MGYQPVLDGIRAVAVVIVILYHAGFEWMHGGFFGVEVFFVVSGYLITSLLLDEHRRDGKVSLGQFWLRRARRLLPALFTMLAAVALWATFFGEDHLAQLSKDILPATFYVSNWAQIVGDVPYFSTEAPLLRHVWSLAVEEQWYILWPLAFVGLIGLAKGRIGRSRLPLALTVASLASMAFSIVLTLSDAPAISLLGQDPDRYNFLYLNTISRASGLLLGASMAFWWRPWTRRRTATTTPPGGVSRADVAGIVAVTAIVAISATRAADILADASLYRLWLPLVTVLSAIAVGAMVDPDAVHAQRIFASRALVEVGKRSYGLYLWHWPVFVFADVRAAQGRFVPAMLISIAIAEACYRFVETPVRNGALRRWWVAAEHAGRERRTGIAALYVFAGIVLTGTLGARLVTAETFDVAVDESDVAFDPSVLADVSTTVVPPTATTPTPAETTPSAAPTTTAPAVTTPPLPRRVVIVGDSQAHSLAVNLPSGIESTFDISDGSVEGCGVLDEGSVRSARESFRRSFAECAGWQQEWGDAALAADAELALVVIGAWDVFDLEVDGAAVPFGSATGDERILAGVRSGIDALATAGAHTVLLEVPCMRPQDVEGAGVPALPERGDDARIAHLNDLLRLVADQDPLRATFVEGPDEWCNNETIATDLGYRWDGVHVYTPGAKLIYEAIAPDLLTITA